MSDKLKFAIVGTNFVSDWMAESLKDSDSADDVAVCSRTEGSAAAFVAKHPEITRVYHDFDEMLESDIDAVYIASPNRIHYTQAFSALCAGKHVLVEKPACPTVKEFLELTRVSNVTKSVLMEAMRPVHDPAFAFVADNLSKIGPVRTANLEFCQYSSRYDKFREGIILDAFDPKKCNSSMMDIGVYPIQMLIYLFGYPEKTLSESYLLSNGFEGEGTFIAKYPSGLLATVKYSKLHDTSVPSTICGEKGSIYIDKISQPGVVTVSMRDGTEEVYRSPEYRVRNMGYEIEDFVQLIKERNTAHIYNSVTHDTLRLMEQLMRSNGVKFC